MCFLCPRTEVGVPWEGFDPGTPTQGEVRMEACSAAGLLLLQLYQDALTVEVSTKLVD